MPKKPKWYVTDLKYLRYRYTKNVYIFCTKINKAYIRNTVYNVGQNVIMISVKKNSKIHSELKFTH